MRKAVKILLITFGIIDSIYLLIPADTCPLSGCSSLIFKGINFPAVLGLIWFSTYPLLKGKFLKFWQIAAISGILFLASYAIVTSYYCPYCFSAYLAGILLIIVDNKIK